jgi:hypothetical protein
VHQGLSASQGQAGPHNLSQYRCNVNGLMNAPPTIAARRCAKSDALKRYKRQLRQGRLRPPLLLLTGDAHADGPVHQRFAVTVVPVSDESYQGSLSSVVGGSFASVTQTRRLLHP